ncbi:MAG: aminoglycoside phosphotransferase family protein [Planctomycetes bacterium]|nr:aminoglycoside phosphotransferase family protein [Planctomycetota bacterium]
METSIHPEEILSHFALPAPMQSWNRYGNGHINDTLLIHCDGADCVAQRLNNHVFPDGLAVMNNISRVLEHLARRESDPHRRLSLVPTRDGRHWIQDGDGAFWRVYPLIAGTVTIEQVTQPAQARAAAYAFARFLALLADLPGEPLAVVIPDFHDTPSRLAKLAEAVKADPCGRLAGVADETRWALDQGKLAATLLAARDAGELAEMATHNDTKINNLLMDPDGKTARCVIDLDTLMPGLTLFDFGDLVRTASCRAAEDGDPADMTADMEFLAALVDGWLAGRGNSAGPAERRLMAVAGAVITFEIGTRFLTDHIQGDRYFRIHRPDHNRDRALAQFALAKNLLARSADIAAMVK